VNENGDGGTSRKDVESVEEWSAAVFGGKAVGGEMAYAASGGCEWNCGGEGREKGKGKRTLLHSHHRAQMDCSVLPKPPHFPSAQAFPSKTGSTSLSSSHRHATSNTEKGQSLFHSFLFFSCHTAYRIILTSSNEGGS